MPDRTHFTDPNLGQTESADANEDEGEFYEICDEDDDHEEGTAEEAANPRYKMLLTTPKLSSPGKPVW